MAQAELITKFAAATEDTNPDGAADHLLTLDATGPALKKVKPDNLAVGKIKAGTPASASATGVAGSIRYDSGFLYVCVGVDEWERVPIASW